VSRRWRGLRFPSLATAPAKLPVEDAILDGEIVCPAEHGVSQFNRLLSREAEPVFYAFDLLSFGGTDLRQLPLIERKRRRAKLVRTKACSGLLYAQHIEANGNQFFQEICSRDLEGIIAKRSVSIYRATRRSTWLKIKNRSNSQAEGRHELLTKRAAKG
jgi:bifunctional non-homologous end joining protein LigD